MILAVANGIALSQLPHLLGIRPNTAKENWVSLQRGNERGRSNALPQLATFDRFLVFANINNGWGYIERAAGAVWCRSLAEEDEEGEVVLRQTSLTLREFVELNVKNAV